MKILGMILVISCGSCLGICVSAAYRRKTAVLEEIADMLLGMTIKLEYGTPTVEEMLAELGSEMAELPQFMIGSDDRNTVIERLGKDSDGLSDTDAAKLSELFQNLGSADKDSELQRINSVRNYFLQRVDTERPKNEKRAELARKLGVLCGIFAAIMLL